MTRLRSRSAKQASRDESVSPALGDVPLCPLGWSDIGYPNNFGILLRDHNAHLGPLGASRVDRDHLAHRANSKFLVNGAW